MQPSSFFWNVSYMPRRLVERHLVGREVRDAERVGGVVDERQDVVDPAVDVRLPHPDLQLAVEDLHHRERVLLAAVDTADRDRAAAPGGLQRRVQRRQPVDRAPCR